MTPQQTLESCVAKMHARPTLRLNSRDDPRGKIRAVREWQVLMQREMRAAIKPDGIFGPDTVAATMAFQRKAGLPADGVVGPKTWTAAAVAPCYALAVATMQASSSAAALASRSKVQQQMQALRQAQVVHGVGDLSFSVLDMKSVILGAVLGLGAGAVLFRRK